MVVGHYSCPQQLGDRINDFLNAFALGIITDRTLVYRYCDRGCPFAGTKNNTCDPFLKLKSWVTPAQPNHKPNRMAPAPADIREMLQSPESVLDPGYAVQHEVAAAVGPCLQPSGGSWCGDCRHGEMASVFVSYAKPPLDRVSACPSCGGTCTLPPSFSRRANLLFSGGVFAAYGLLYEAAFAAQLRVAPPRSIQRAAAEGHFFAGVHLRHPGREDGTDISDVEPCIYDVLQARARSPATCTLLVATDRAGTVSALHNSTIRQLCRIVHPASDLPASERGVAAGATAMMKSDLFVENGPWSGAVVKDFELLSVISQVLFANPLVSGLGALLVSRVLTKGGTAVDLTSCELITPNFQPLLAPALAYKSALLQKPLL